MEDHNWTGNNSGAALGDPDIKASRLAPHANRVLLDTGLAPIANTASKDNTICIEHVRPYFQLATALANHNSAQYNFIYPQPLPRRARGHFSM
jgi:hypothetical protein